MHPPSAKPDARTEAEKVETEPKCDSAGSAEAVISTLIRGDGSRQQIEVVGAISKPDVLMAISGSRPCLEKREACSAKSLQ